MMKLKLFLASTVFLGVTNAALAVTPMIGDVSVPALKNGALSSAYPETSVNTAYSMTCNVSNTSGWTSATEITIHVGSNPGIYEAPTAVITKSTKSVILSNVLPILDADGAYYIGIFTNSDHLPSNTIVYCTYSK